MVVVLEIISITNTYLNDHKLIATEFVLAYKSYLPNINSLAKFYGFMTHCLESHIVNTYLRYIRHHFLRGVGFFYIREVEC